MLLRASGTQSDSKPLQGCIFWLPFRCNIALPFLATADWLCNHCSDRRLWQESKKDSSKFQEMRTYFSSHNHGSWKWVLPRFVSFTTGSFSTSTIKGGKKTLIGFWPCFHGSNSKSTGEAGRSVAGHNGQGGCSGLYFGRRDEQNRMLHYEVQSPSWSGLTGLTAKTWDFFEQKSIFFFTQPFLEAIFPRCVRLPTANCLRLLKLQMLQKVFFRTPNTAVHAGYPIKRFKVQKI